MSAAADLAAADTERASDPLLSVRGLTKIFPIRGGVLKRAVGGVKAVDDVSFTIGRGEVLGLVGESGSGKTTIGRCVLRLVEPTAGEVILDGTDVTRLGRAELKRFRRHMQIVFQDPYASLNPRMKVGPAIEEILAVNSTVPRREQRERVAELFRRVGLPADAMNSFPHEFSGGQRQRIGIARALAVEPQFIVADEPVSALDVSIQAQVLNLIMDLQEELALTVLFVSHDLATVEHLCDRVVVLYLGRIMEVASSVDLYAHPSHPYTEALLSAAPVPDPEISRQRIVLSGEIPNPADPPSGCVFRTRCRYATEECARTVPELREVRPNHFKACIRDDIL
jgi:oligopeptide/dipeptide ABC transporter ATP-binding protein